MKIVNLGSLNIDKTYSVEHFARPGETIKAKSYREYCGGKGLNQSIALSRAGAEVYHAGKVGEDGAILRKALEDSGVNLTYLEKGKQVSGHAIIQIDEAGQNNIIISGGANEELDKQFIEKVLGNFLKGDILLLQNEISNVAFAIEEAKRRGLTIAFNPSPLDKKILGYPLKDVDLFIMNEIEAVEILRGEHLNIGQEESWVDQHGIREEDLRKAFPKATFVITLGEKGSVYFDENTRVEQDIFPTKVVDTTGAGDTFCGYFLAGLTKGLLVKDCLELASAAASISVSKPGAAASIPLWEEAMLHVENHK